MATYHDNMDLSDLSGLVPPQVAGGPYIVSAFTQTVLFSDLAAGAADSIALTGFPTNVLIVGAALEINTAFAGEPNTTVTLGDTGDADELIAAFTLDSVAAGFAQTVAGAAVLPKVETDYGTAGADLTFAATELSDLTAGSLTVHILYVDLVLAT